MWSEVLVRYGHFLGILLLMGLLMSEHLLIKPQMTRNEIRKFSKVDAFVGLAAIFTMIMGLILWIGVGKPKEFYTKNPVMHIKLTLFMAIFFLSLVPTIWFIKNRKGEEKEVIDVPKKHKMIIRIELVFLLLMPFVATLLARGIGLP